MTAQIGDIYKYHKKEYSIVALSAPKLFSPKDYGLETHPSTTACWEGYWCKYVITDSELRLKHLYIFNKDGNYPVLNGVKAFPPKEEYKKKRQKMSLADYFGHYTYKNLNLSIPYTGKILLGRDFIDEYYIHMGFQRGWAYKELMEFVFEAGVLLECNDLSHVAELQREIMEQQKINPRHPDDSDIVKFIDTSFSLDYSDKAWWLKE